MRVGIASTDTDPVALLARVRESGEMKGSELSSEVSTRETYVVPAQNLADGAKPFVVAALDLGIKANTPRMLSERGVEVHVLPADATLEQVNAVKIGRASCRERVCQYV